MSACLSLGGICGYIFQNLKIMSSTCFLGHKGRSFDVRRYSLFEGENVLTASEDGTAKIWSLRKAPPTEQNQTHNNATMDANGEKGIQNCTFVTRSVIFFLFNCLVSQISYNLKLPFNNKPQLRSKQRSRSSSCMCPCFKPRPYQTFLHRWIRWLSTSVECGR